MHKVKFFGAMESFHDRRLPMAKFFWRFVGNNFFKAGKFCRLFSNRWVYIYRDEYMHKVKFFGAMESFHDKQSPMGKFSLRF
jgi:hypothetical protein